MSTHNVFLARNKKNIETCFFFCFLKKVPYLELKTFHILINTTQSAFYVNLYRAVIGPSG